MTARQEQPATPESHQHRATLFIHDEARRYDFGPQHPLQPIRLVALLDLIEEMRLFDAGHDRRVPALATSDELGLVHSPSYVEAVASLSGASYPLRGADAALAETLRLGPGDTPAFPGMHEASAAIAGATLAAVRSVMSGDVHHAFSPSGGLHHAMADHGWGFCIYNDPAIGIAAAVRDFGARVLYVDFDAHHGDGVQAAFYADPRVLTVSFHESGRYLFPGSGGVEERGAGPGTGYAVNVPMQPYTQDASWLHAVETLVPALCRRFAPDLIVSQHGADGHVWDPLTHLALTVDLFAAETELIHRLAHQHCGGRWVACGGGGYQLLRVVPRAWTSLWAEMCGRPVQGALPADWLARWSPRSPEPIPDSFRDPPDAFPEVDRRVEIEAANEATLARLVRSVLP